MLETTIGIFDVRSDAESAIAELRGLGVLDSDISYIYTSPESNEVVVTKAGHSAVGSRAAGGATTGAVLGAIAGFAVANGLLPGFGTLFVAGPLATALGLTGAVATTAAGAMTGLAAGGLLGALTGIGVKPDEALIYEERVKRGGILVTARSTVSDAVRDTFKKFGASEIRQYPVS